MLIANAIYGCLTDDSAVSAIVDDRVYPHRSPPDDSVYPLIVYKPASVDFDRTHSGKLNRAVQDVDIACIAETYSDVVSLSQTVIDAMDEQSGTWGDVIVQNSLLVDNGEDLEAEPIDNGLWVMQMTFSVAYVTDES